jgi:hypothetical protein
MTSRGGVCHANRRSQATVTQLAGLGRSLALAMWLNTALIASQHQDE